MKHYSAEDRDAGPAGLRAELVQFMDELGTPTGLQLEPNHGLHQDDIFSRCNYLSLVIEAAPSAWLSSWSLGKSYPYRVYLLELDSTMSVLKRKDFARWQAGEKLPNDALCRAVKEMENGLIDADLGGFLYKKRVARPGGGKSGGYRTVISAQIGERYVFLHGFAKKDTANITQDEKKALQFAGKVFLDLAPAELAKALRAGVLVEVHCGEQAH